MTPPRQLVAINGSTSSSSRTRVLVQAIVGALSALTPLESEVLELGALAPHIGAATCPQALGPLGVAALRSIEQADILVVASPVYNGSYAGLFKHLIDFVHPQALVGRPVLLAATGGSDRHALVVDQQLRPLFGFFRALTVPSAVYASAADFDGQALASEALDARIREAAQQAVGLLLASPARVQPQLRVAA